MLVPIRMDTNMTAGNQQKHSVTGICYKSVNLSLEELKKKKKNETILFFPIQELLRTPNVPK